MRKIGKNMCRVREICAEGDKTSLVTRVEAVEIAKQKIEEGYSVAVKVGSGATCLVQPEALEPEILKPDVDVEVVIVPPVVGG